MSPGPEGIRLLLVQNVKMKEAAKAASFDTSARVLAVKKVILNRVLSRSGWGGGASCCALAWRGDARVTQASGGLQRRAADAEHAGRFDPARRPHNPIPHDNSSGSSGRRSPRSCPKGS